MERATALQILQENAAELRWLGAVSVSLFGSQARGSSTSASDIDVAVKLDPTVRGFYAFGALDRIQSRLGELLRGKVDVIPEPTAGPLKATIERDRCIVF
ncbi:MAG: nucleotidyltransferase domain-containing protein [Hyphomicrobiaceae bacterium]|nr:nucleotidyltransferase domain-containing protein [Hyphomicrobiaceae bacterium]